MPRWPCATPATSTPVAKKGVSIWVVAASDIVASSPDEKDSFFDPAGDKIYRHPTFYEVPEDVEYL
jgi:ring-1,2-phenylacetyl-CoA epoxidase subunit PaaB